MHIVHLETGRHLYGGARQVLLLLDGLAEAGVHSTLMCPADSAIASAADGSKTDIITLPMRGDLDVLFVRRFARALADVAPDLVHVHSRRGADIWGGLAGRPAGVPAVLTRRVDNPEARLLGAFKYGLYDRIIAISNAIGAQVVADGAAEEKLRVVHSAIDAGTCQPVWTRQQFVEAFGCRAEQLLVVCVAQLIERKGHADLLRAWQAVVANVPTARLLLFGRGPEEANLRAQATQAGLNDSVHFAGFRDDLRQFVGCADLLVHPAHREGLGICLLEAQAAGVPVVAAHAGGIPEAVLPGGSAELVESGDVAALGQVITGLLGDPDRRARMAAAGRRFVAQDFSPAAMVSGNLAVYKELLTVT